METIKNSMRTLTSLLLVATAAACTSPVDRSIVPPDRGVRPVYSVPGGSSGASDLLFGPGARFVFNGATAPGTASFVGAPVLDQDDEPTSSGGGAANVTVDGQLYSVTAFDSFAVLLEDSTTYVALLGYVERPGPSASSTIDEVIVIVPASDVVAGSSVALDGGDRLALFVSGDPEAGAPEVLAAAVTGNVTFTAGAPTAGSTVSATLAADFGSIELVDEGPPTGSTTLADGSFSLALGTSADVYCEGSLAGQESAFASITAASLGFADGTVTIGGSGTTIAGSPIASGFGAPSLALENVDTGLYAAFSEENAAGPAGTTLVGKYIVLDATSASATFINAGVGAGYITANDDGQCTVAYGAALTAP